MDKLTAQKILGVSPGASKREIKRAYAAMLRMYHPEDYPEEFQKIQEAYETLNKGGFQGEQPGDDWEDTWESLDNGEEDWKRQQQEERRRKQQEEELRRRQQEEEYRRARQREEQYRRKIQEEEYRKAREELDFEKIEWKAREEKKLKEKCRRISNSPML